ncbi:alpha/beta-hydrolase [Glonium stellatum]|uniref:Alpha/beta-hydrolase n=1 Tax=Glonium stellatum TaxID=574774 RepID=A0A8E2F277_9PEZI|nr:alpha/beta-hydrolase [Glonium stellatum]
MPFFTHDSASLFYTDEGSGQPALLLHGWSCDSHDWSFQIPMLLKLGLRVIALDQRGHGRSSAPPGSYAPRILVEDAFALLNHLKTGPVVLFGHSMGTIIASILTVEHPEAVKALVVVHPIYGGVSPILTDITKQMREGVARAPQLAADFFERVMYTPRTPEWVKTWNRRRVLGNAPEAIVGCLEGLLELYGKVVGQSEEAKMFMRRRECPRLAVCTLKVASEWESEIGIVEGRDEVHLVEEGTFAHLVEAETVNGIIEGWLKKMGLSDA